VGGKPRADFIEEVLGGTAANANMLEGRTFDEVLAQAAGQYDELYAQTNTMYSRDRSTTPNPTATPYRYILLGEVGTISAVEVESLNSISVTHPDVFWFAAGGHRQESTPETNASASSPAYLVHAKNGLNADAHKFEVTRLTGNADSDV